MVIYLYYFIFICFILVFCFYEIYLSIFMVFWSPEVVVFQMCLRNKLDFLFVRLEPTTPLFFFRRVGHLLQSTDELITVVKPSVNADQTVPTHQDVHDTFKQLSRKREEINPGEAFIRLEQQLFWT